MHPSSFHFSIVVGCIVVIAGLAACAPEGTAKSGAAIFRQNCVVCHGPTGAGDGVQASQVSVPPANLRRMAAANDGVFPTEFAMAAIFGYRGKDYAALMPEFGPLFDGPTVIWRSPKGQEFVTPLSLLALARYLETIQDP